MTLFTPDLFRQFSFGFVAGALIVGLASFAELSEQIAPPAHAQEVASAPEPSEGFWSMSE